jgi:hypothetical protein
MCSDGTSVYVAFKDTNANPNETHRVQAYDIDGWSRKTGWPATGTALSGTGTTGIAFEEGDIQVVSATEIATTSPWVTITGPTDDAITVINMVDGTLPVNAGAGSATTHRACKLTSDGTNIYYTTGTSAVAKINKCSLANPEAVPADYPFVHATTTNDVLCIGELIITSSNDTGAFLIGTATEENLVEYQSGDAKVARSCGSLAFDGLNIWTQGSTQTGGGNVVQAVFKISPNNATYESTGVPVAAKYPLEHAVKETFVLDMDNYDVNDTEHNPICYDGRDIYTIGDYRASQPLSGKIYRIPKAILR